MKRAGKTYQNRYCYQCELPVGILRDSVAVDVDGEARLFHKELCYAAWKRSVVAQSREQARQEARKLKRERQARERISNQHTQQQVVRTREPELSSVSLRDLLVEVANCIGTRLDGIEHTSLKLSTLVDQLLRGGRA